MYTISIATKDDIPALTRLVNSAYRGESSKKGWTTEAELLDGVRIDETELAKILDKANANIYKYEEDKHLLGCVLLERQDSALYLGMLTVSPTLQGKGIGKILLSHAESVAANTDCNSIEMTVISVRKELIDWSKRHGYVDTGKRKQFYVEDGRFGIPKVPFEFMVLAKAV